MLLTSRGERSETECWCWAMIVWLLGPTQDSFRSDTELVMASQQGGGLEYVFAAVATILAPVIGLYIVTGGGSNSEQFVVGQPRRLLARNMQ